MLLAGYRDVELVGEGGLGRVYRAVRVSTGGVVAIKELRAINAGSPAWHRARRELDALLRLKGHSHVINVEEVIDGPDGPCLIMEFAPNGSLFDRLQLGPLSAPELVLVGQHVCDALSASHAVGIIHRDIKPHNLLISAFGQVKVCDFGIASLARDDETRTRTGALTMAYASPEEIDGSDDIGAAADTAKIWDTTTGTELTTLTRRNYRKGKDGRSHGSQVNSAAFSPDGTRIVTASGDRTAKIWDAITGTELTTLTGHTGWVGSAAFNPDGTRVVTSSGDATSKIWYVS